MRMHVMANFWDITVWFLEAFVFVASLLALFWIIGDLMRDRRLNVWLKAVWIVFLVFVPLLTALVYLIARGRGMAERRAADIRAAQDQTEDYIRTIAGTRPADEIAKAKALLDAGTITDREYETLKAKALADHS